MSTNTETTPARKAQLEVRKLELEVSHLERRWWQSPGYLLAALPTAIAVASLLVAWRSGLLDAKAINLDTKRSALQLEVKMFEEKRDRLGLANVALEAKSRELLQELQALQAMRAHDVATYEQKKVALIASNNALLRRQTELDSKLSELANAEADARTANEGLTTQQVELTESANRAEIALAGAKRELKMEPLRRFFARIEQQPLLMSLDRWWPEEFSDHDVVLQMQTDSELKDLWVPELERYAAEESNRPYARAKALRAAALGTRDQARQDAHLQYVLTWARNNTLADDFRRTILTLDDMFARGMEWTDDEVHEIVIFATALIEHEHDHPDATAALFELISAVVRNHITYRVDERDPLLFRRLALAAMDATRRHALSAKRWRAAEPAASVLASIAPPALLVNASEILASGQRGERVVFNGRIWDEVEILELDVHLLSLASEPTQKRFGRKWDDSPRTLDAAAWRTWRRRHDDMIAAWSKLADREPTTVVGLLR